MDLLTKLLIMKNRNLQGIQGVQGIQGLKGDQGVQGVKGDQGVQGIQGLKGDQGIQGTTGYGIQLLGTLALVADLPVLNNVQGDTYLITAENGHGYSWNAGLGQWVDIGPIQGPQGIQGIQGLQGIQGIQGVKGDQGVQGVKGDQGVQGVQGAQGLKGDTGNAGNIEVYINKTGEVSVKGTVVTVCTTVDLAVEKIVKDIPNPIGVIYEDGIADGDAVRVVMSGSADVLYVGSVTRGGLARGFLTSDGASYVAGKAMSEAIPTTPFASDKHFYEIGHPLESRVGAGLARTALHFN